MMMRARELKHMGKPPLSDFEGLVFLVFNLLFSRFPYMLADFLVVLYIGP